MDILPLLLEKKHADSLSEEKRQRVICDFICLGVRRNLGFFTRKIKFMGKYYKYSRCYDHTNSPLSLLTGMAGIAYYEPNLYLLLVWDISALTEVAKMQEKAVDADMNLRVVVFNWKDEIVNFSSHGIRGGNTISAALCPASIFEDNTHPSWMEYQGRNLSPRQE